MEFEELLDNIENNKLLSNDDLDETELCLDDNNLSKEQIKSLIKALKFNTTIKTVGRLCVLDNNTLEYLLELVKTNHTITKLDFIIIHNVNNNQCKELENLKDKINDFITSNQIFAMDCKNKTSIKIINGTIGPESTEALIKILKKYPNIVHVDLTETMVNNIDYWKHLFDAYEKGDIAVKITTIWPEFESKLKEIDTQHEVETIKSMDVFFKTINIKLKSKLLDLPPEKLQKKLTLIEKNIELKSKLINVSQKELHELELIKKKLQKLYTLALLKNLDKDSMTNAAEFLLFPSYQDPNNPKPNARQEKIYNIVDGLKSANELEPTKHKKRCCVIQ